MSAMLTGAFAALVSAAAHNNIRMATVPSATSSTAAVLVCCLIGCTPLPIVSEHSETVSFAQVELQRRVVTSSRYQHVVFFESLDATRNGPTWIFIDGDGNAWLRGGRVAEDPTPEDPIALRLLVQQEDPGLYLGRPCVFGTVDSDPACVPGVWVVDRYAEDVIASMHDALARLGLAQVPVVLVGYSGGGVLARALARRLERAVGVITIASNLDVAAWAAHHGYTDRLVPRDPLIDSALPPHIVQLHVFGDRDENAPLALSRTLLERDPRAVVKVLDADHVCCWPVLWPAVRDAFQQLMEAESRNTDSRSSR